MGKHDQYSTNKKIEKWKSDTLVMEDEDCLTQMFEY